MLKNPMTLLSNLVDRQDGDLNETLKNINQFLQLSLECEEKQKQEDKPPSSQQISNALYLAQEFGHKPPFLKSMTSKQVDAYTKKLLGIS